MNPTLSTRCPRITRDRNKQSCLVLTSMKKHFNTHSCRDISFNRQVLVSGRKQQEREGTVVGAGRAHTAGRKHF